MNRHSRFLTFKREVLICHQTMETCVVEMTVNRTYCELQGRTKNRERDGPKVLRSPLYHPLNYVLGTINRGADIGGLPWEILPPQLTFPGSGSLPPCWTPGVGSNALPLSLVASPQTQGSLPGSTHWLGAGHTGLPASVTSMSSPRQLDAAATALPLQATTGLQHLYPSLWTHPGPRLNQGRQGLCLTLSSEVRVLFPTGQQPQGSNRVRKPLPTNSPGSPEVRHHVSRPATQAGWWLRQSEEAPSVALVTQGNMYGTLENHLY